MNIHKARCNALFIRNLPASCTILDCSHAAWLFGWRDPHWPHFIWK